MANVEKTMWCAVLLLAAAWGAARAFRDAGYRDTDPSRLDAPSLREQARVQELVLFRDAWGGNGCGTPSLLFARILEGDAERRVLRWFAQRRRSR